MNPRVFRTFGSFRFSIAGTFTTILLSITLISPTASVASTQQEKIVLDNGGGEHYCVRLADNGLWCWGANYYGQLGDGTTVDKPVATLVRLTEVNSVGAGFGHTCAARANLEIYCWGSNDSFNGVGVINSGENLVQPTQVGSWGEIADAYYFRTCGRSETPPPVNSSEALNIDCWGTFHPYFEYWGGRYPETTQLKLGGSLRCLFWPSTISDPGYVSCNENLLSTVESVSAGWDHACAVMQTGEIKCLGGQAYGQLGNGVVSQTMNQYTWQKVTGVNNAQEVSSGVGHTCAVLTDQTARCWGYNDSGQLGDGTRTDRSTPVVVRGITGVTDIQAGNSSTCAVIENIKITCWGSNTHGQLGDNRGQSSHVIFRPSVLTAPGLSGDGLRRGQVLTLDLGEWSSLPSPALAVRWYRCTNPVQRGLENLPKKSKCKVIAKAKSTQYTLGIADRGRHIVAFVTGTNADGKRFSTSNSAGKVQ